MQGFLSIIVVVAIVASVESFAPFTSRVVLRTALKAATDGTSSWSNLATVVSVKNEIYIYRPATDLLLQLYLKK